MAVLLVTALIVLIGIAAMGVLADSGLRWWSAFGRLRRELAIEFAPALPAQRVSVNYSSFGRAQQRPLPRRPAISRAAA